MAHRPRAWADLKFQAQIVSGGIMTPLNILADLGANVLDTVTVTRLIGSLHAFIEMPNPEVQGIMACDLTIGVVGSAGFTAGVPDPGITSEYPIRGYLYATTKWIGQNSGANSSQNQHMPAWDVDLGAMRKIDKGILYVAAKNTLVDGVAFTIRVGGRIRALCLT